MTPGIFDFDWVRGTTTPFKVRMTVDDVAIPYDDMRLSVYAGSTFLFRLSTVGTPGTSPQEPGTAYESEPGYVSFMPSAAQTRLLKKTASGAPGKNNYEVEIRNGHQEDVWLMGAIAGLGGINDDESEVS